MWCGLWADYGRRHSCLDSCPTMTASCLRQGSRLPAAVLPAQLLWAVEQRLPRVLETAKGQEAGNMMWSLATLGHKPSQRVMAMAAQRFIDVVVSADPQEISNRMWALSMLDSTLIAGFLETTLLIFEQLMLVHPTHVLPAEMHDLRC